MSFFSLVDKFMIVGSRRKVFDKKKRAHYLFINSLIILQYVFKKPG